MSKLKGFHTHFNVFSTINNALFRPRYLPLTRTLRYYSGTETHLTIPKGILPMALSAALQDRLASLTPDELARLTDLTRQELAQALGNGCLTNGHPIDANVLLEFGHQQPQFQSLGSLLHKVR